MNIILIIFALLLHWSPSWALSIDQEQISGFQRGTGPFGWDYSYDIGVSRKHPHHWNHHSVHYQPLLLISPQNRPMGLGH